MELLGGLLVLLVMVWFGLTVCVGGLCSDRKAMKEPRGGHTMKMLPFTVGAAAMLMSAPAFAQTGAGLAQIGKGGSFPAEPATIHPALFPFNVASVAAGVSAHATGQAAMGVTVEGEGAAWHPALYPFVVAGERREMTRVAKRAQVAVVGSEPAVWHPALAPFNIEGR